MGTRTTVASWSTKQQHCRGKLIFLVLVTVSAEKSIAQPSCHPLVRLEQRCRPAPFAEPSYSNTKVELTRCDTCPPADLWQRDSGVLRAPELTPCLDEAERLPQMLAAADSLFGGHDGELTMNNTGQHLFRILNPSIVSIDFN